MVWRAAIFLGLLGYSPGITTEGMNLPPWDNWIFGAPCSTETDKLEGTCRLEVKRKPDWSKK